MSKKSSLNVIKANTMAKSNKMASPSQRPGLIVPFYARFAGKGGGTVGPPTNWLTRK